MAVPTDFAGLSLWLDATDLQDPTIPLQGEAISQWTDKSGNNRHFTAAGSARPMRIDKGSPSGLSIVRFDGSLSQMSSAATWADISNGSIYTLFVVAAVTGKASADLTNLMNNDLLFGSGGTNYGGLNVKDNANNPDFIAYNWDGTADTVITAGLYNTFYIIQSDHATTGQGTLNLRLNGGAAASVTTGAMSNMTFPLKLGVVGGTNFGAIEYCEIIAYNNVLSTADRQAIEQYLTARWLTPPGTPLTNTKLHFFRDGFKWFDTTKYPQTANVRVVDDRLTHTATTTTVSTSAWWTNQYDLTDSWMYCRAWPDKGGAQRWCGMYVMKDPYNYVYWFSFGPTTLYARKTQAGIVTEVGNIAYDAVQHAYWRIEYSGGNILFRTAPDPVDGSGHVWTTRFTTTVPNWPLHLVKPHFQTSDLDLISCIAQYDNLNLRPATQHTLTLTDDELIAAGFVEGSNMLKAFVMDESGNWST